MRSYSHDKALTPVTSVNVTASAPSPPGTTESNKPYHPSRPLEILPGIAMIIVFCLLLLLGYRAWFWRRRTRTQESVPKKTTKDEERKKKLVRIEAIAKVQTYKEWRAEALKAASTGRGDDAPRSFVTQQLVCPICLDVLEEQSHVRCLPCEHVFHQDCLETWYLKGRYSCPMCKSPFCSCPKSEKVESNEQIIPGPMF